jgi:hypothetical protein
MTGVLCGKVRPFTSVSCIRDPGHPGQHKDADKNTWGGKERSEGTHQKVTPLPAGKPLAPYRSAPAPGYAKFKDTPGQMAMDIGSDDPGALVKPKNYIEP